jgi:hypothetical protein
MFKLSRKQKITDAADLHGGCWMTGLKRITKDNQLRQFTTLWLWLWLQEGILTDDTLSTQRDPQW